MALLLLFFGTLFLRFGAKVFINSALKGVSFKKKSISLILALKRKTFERTVQIFHLSYKIMNFI